MRKTTFITAGDAFVTRRLPEGGYEGFQELKSCIESHDVRFLNLESTFHEQESFPAAESGGTWAMSDPRTLDDMKEYGFNLFNTANNHSGDFGPGGVLATIRNLKQRDMIFSGTGKDLAEAAKPCYLETKYARVALLSCCSSFNKGSMAGPSTVDMLGRPGVNPMRFDEVLHLDPETFQKAREVIEKSQINHIKDKSIRNGYAMPSPEGFANMGGKKMALDDHCWIESKLNEQDWKRMETEIKEARRQADVVLVSIHNHFIDGIDTNRAPQFLEDFSRRCIDAGANVVIGHGPHELQGIEIYNGGVIFYSIGNFIFETETVEFQPGDAYANRKMPAETKVGEYMDNRSKNGTQGHCVQWPIWNAVMGAWTMEDGAVTEVQLYPIELGMKLPRGQKGVPVMNHSEETLKYLQQLCEPYGTNMEIENGVGYIRLK